jgi:hypothetical protein
VTEEQAFTLFAPFLQSARKHFPGFFVGVTSTQAFLLRQPSIHYSLATGLLEPERCAVANKFRVEATPTGIRLHYRSPNRLAALYMAVTRQLAQEFRETANMHFERGGPTSPECIISVSLAPARPLVDVAAE